jgi:ATP-binding cassette subfamily B protein
MARLYDPTDGTIFLDGRDIKSYAHEVRVKKIGFILQDPFLFSGSIKDNILYGNPHIKNISDNELAKLLKKEGLEKLLQRFPEGLGTIVDTASSAISLGQKQLIAFMRAILRQPELLILDEATANIDTVTEQLLDDVIKNLPGHTTIVIIAHRLNTIANADQILFVNAGTITPAGSLHDAVAMLEKGVRKS